jgi:hypothetical protein
VDVENAVYPTHANIEALMADHSGHPVVMLNLLRFPGEGGLCGRAPH